jgi:hypothetical protein
MVEEAERAVVMMMSLGKSNVVVVATIEPRKVCDWLREGYNV